MGFNTVRIMNADIEPRHQTGELNIQLFLMPVTSSNNNDPVPINGAPANPTDPLYRYYEQYCYLYNGTQPNGIIHLVNAMQTVLEVAKYYNLKVIWVMGTENRAYYDGQLHYKSLLQHINTEDDFSWINNKYGEALAYIGDIFKNNSSLLAYELYHENESFADSEFSGENPVNQASVGDAVRLVVNYLKVVDSNHLTTSGLFGENSFFKLGVKPFYYTDFFNFHFYEFSQEIFETYARGTLINRYQYYLYKSSLNYPWIVGEHGIETFPSHNSELNETDLLATEEEQKTLVENVMNFSSICGSSGYTYWQFANERGWQNHGLLKISDNAIVETVPISNNPVYCYFDYKQIVNPPEMGVFKNFEISDEDCDFDQELYYKIYRDLDYPILTQTWHGYVKDNDVPVPDAIVSIHVGGSDYYTFTNGGGYFNYETPTSFAEAKISATKYGYNVDKKTHYIATNNIDLDINLIGFSTKNQYYKNLIVAENSMKIIDKPTNFNGNAIVETGATLIIRDTVSFGPETQLLLYPGSKLILEKNGALTAIHQRWRGIYAYNSNDDLIEIVSTGSNSSISKADIAIRTKYNVAINLKGTNFYNNMRDVDMELNDAQILFVNCNFIQTPDAINPCIESPSCDYCFDLYECGYVKIMNCHFEDQRIGTVDVNKSGIYAKNIDKLEILPDSYMGLKRSSFINLKYGILAIANGGGELTVKNTDFKTARGIYMYNYDGFLPKIITNNIFEIIKFPRSVDKEQGGGGEDDPDEFLNQAYGVYIDCNSGGYQVEGNTFKSDVGNSRFGLVANNNGTLPNKFYRNKFVSLENAVQSINKNRNTTDGNNVGLQILCNDFNNTKTDIYVTSEDPNISNINWGIAGYQGSLSNPAANLFSTNTPLDSYTINNELTHITYFARADYDPYWNPREWPNSVSEKVVVSMLYFGDIPNACPDYTNKLPTPIDEDLLRREMSTAKSLENAITSMLNDIVDGGNTGQTISSVLHADDNKAWLIYYDLIGKSPYLSDTVLKEVSKKEQGLTAPMIRDILVANPQGIKNKDLQQMLKDRDNPLPDYMIEQIEAGFGIISAKENLELQRAEQQVIYEENLKTLVEFYISISDFKPWAEDSIYSLLDGSKEPRFMYLLADYYFSKYDYTKAKTELDRIIQFCELSEDEIRENRDLYDFYNLYANLMKKYQYNLSNITNPLHIDELKAFEIKGGFAGTKARAILIINNATDYREPVYTPTIPMDNRYIKHSGVNNNNPYFAVYPNPAKEYFYLEYSLPEIIGTMQVVISDISGKILMQKQIYEPRDIIIIKTADLLPGIYNCTLYNGNKSAYNGKIIVE
ncbi:MAG TPA: T9SS type A sorting domain-containing protein [Bacteroidales bacterium]|nr:T9SS type A sorting domain-containing protein [Bacteroidales bacterium]